MKNLTRQIEIIGQNTLNIMVYQFRILLNHF